MTNMPAVGTPAILINVMGKTVVRVYAPDHSSFVDYDLLHSDLAVTITDDEAYFYQKNGRMTIDHSPETLGLVKE